MNDIEGFASLITIFEWLVKLLDFFKERLDSQKPATEAFEGGTRLLGIVDHRDNADEQSNAPGDAEIARAHAAAGLIRSYTMFGLLEYLLWATKVIAWLFLVVQWRKFYVAMFAKGNNRH